MIKKYTEKEQKNLNERLILAIYNNDLSAVKDAIEAGALVNSKDESGYEALFCSCNKDISIMRYLLESGACPNVQDATGWSLLHEVTYQNYGDKTELLLEYNADMYIKDSQGNTPFIMSVDYNLNNIKNIFISHGYIPSKEDSKQIQTNELLKAIESNNLSAVKKAVEAGADINKTDTWNINLPLYTSRNKDISIMEYLLSNGTDPNIQNNNGWTMLHFSVGGFLELTKALLRHNANMYIKNSKGRTPFAEALRINEQNEAELFVFNGYLPTEDDFNNIKDAEKRIPIKERFMALAAQVQEHKTKLTEEVKTTEFAYADEVMEI